MKLRKLLVILLVVGLLACYYVLGTDYQKARHKNTALTSQIGGAALQLAQIPPPPTDIEQRQAAARAGLDSVINTFPARLNSTLIVNTVLKFAEETGVKALPMVTQPRATESVNQTDYPVFRLNVAVRGTFYQLADFINRLENGEPATMVIIDLTVERVAAPGTDEGDITNAAEADASMDIAVYARPLAPILILKASN